MTRQKLQARERAPKPSLNVLYERLVAAGGDRVLAQAAIDAQPHPYVTDVMDGFVIHMLPPAPGEVRLLRASLREKGIEVRHYDTAKAGTTLLDNALIEAVDASDWVEADAFMRKAGAYLHAEVSGKPAVILVDGQSLTVHETDLLNGPRGVSAVIRFASRRSWLVQATVPTSGLRIAGLDWLLVQHRLKEAGIVLEAKRTSARRSSHG